MMSYMRVHIREAKPLMSRIAATKKSLYSMCRPENNHMGGKRKTQRHRDIMFNIDGYQSDDKMLYGTSYGSVGSSSTFGQGYPSPSPTSRRIVDPIVPRNERQEEYLRWLTADDPPIVVAVGPAGVAKTYLCSAVGIQKLLDGTIERLIITRPAVSVDENHGFLPGDINAKLDPWMRPLFDVFHKYVTPNKLKALIEAQHIEICPLAYMRGRTFDNCFIVADETQNSTVSQMMMLMTRIGMGSKLVITGDPNQHDRGFGTNGLNDFLRRLSASTDSNALRDIKVVRFLAQDVERHPVIKHVLNLYNDKSI